MPKNYLLTIHRKYHEWRVGNKLGLTDKLFISKTAEEVIYKKLVEKHGEKIKNIQELKQLCDSKN